MNELVLVVDDDPDVRSVVDVTLRLAGYRVALGIDGLEALELALKLQPDIVVLDVMMPGVDGYEVCRRLREDGRTSHIPVLLLTAKAQLEDKVVGFESGADDYLTKPFDTDELVVRVGVALRRATEARSVSPLTGLPGNIRIEQELARRVASGDPFAFLYADLNHFKAYNDYYGFLRGDDVIRLLARVLREAAVDLGDPATFVGHIGGDDFVVLTTPDLAEPLAEEVGRRFDEILPTLYDEAEREADYVEVTDRQGNFRRFPLVTVSIGIVTNHYRSFADHREVVEIATEMKSFAKRVGGADSNHAVDRRAD